MDQLSKSEIDRLGKRLRAPGDRSAEDASLYVSWSAGYTAALQEVQKEVEKRAAKIELAGTITSRIKQIDSTVAKLRRMKTRLSSLEDIAGCRIVVGTPLDIARIVEQCDSLDTTRVRDYCEDSNDGYRALHITVRASDGRLVEVQLRTDAQDRWAYLVERLCRRAGKDLKYGGGTPSMRTSLDTLSALGAVEDKVLALKAALDREHAQSLRLYKELDQFQSLEMREQIPQYLEERMLPERIRNLWYALAAKIEADQ